MGYSTSHTKCGPLQYLLRATRGVKQAHCVGELSLNPNHSVVSTPFQEKINTVSRDLNTNQEYKDQVSQSESGMYYELLNRKKMECEKYQDCSWFQQNSMKSDCKNIWSPAEVFDSVIDADDEFNMSMQCDEAPMSNWENEYLEVFTDDTLEENHKLEDKKNFISTSNENFYDNYRENNYDFCNFEFSLKKSDSMDSIKNISLTNPSEVIPITYKERLNNPNYDLMKLSKIKNDIKEELHSPVTNLHLIESDDSDLNIGREEEVEEINAVEDLQVVDKKEIINLDQAKSENMFEIDPSDTAVNQESCKAKNSEESNSPVKIEKGCGKLDLNLDIPKCSFEQSISTWTPDLDFMDLVDFINEEMHQECCTTSINSTPKSEISLKKDTTKDLITKEYSCNTNVQPEDSDAPAEFQKIPQPQPVFNSTEVSNLSNCVEDVKNNSNSGVSIAERIKINAKRKTRKNLKDLIESEDDEDCGSSDKDYDEDYDHRENSTKRKSSFTKRQRKSSSLERSTDGKREEIDSYREKRDKNNEASRRSRQNRKARERLMYETLNEEEQKNVRLKARADVLEKEVASFRQLIIQVALQKGAAT